ALAAGSDKGPREAFGNIGSIADILEEDADGRVWIGQHRVHAGLDMLFEIAARAPDVERVRGLKAAVEVRPQPFEGLRRDPGEAHARCSGKIDAHLALAA